MVDSCVLTTDKDQATTAEAILLQSGGIPEMDIKKQPRQIWILWLLESPLNTMDFQFVGDRNWTATYRRDSVIVTPCAFPQCNLCDVKATTFQLCKKQKQDGSMVCVQLWCS